MDKTLNLTNHFPAWSCVQNWAPSSAILTTCKLETSTFTYNQFQAPRHYSLTYFRPSFHGVQFFFLFLSFDKGLQWANAGKRLFKWGKLLSLRWYVQRKSPNFTNVGMVTMVRGTSLQPICWGKGTGNGDCIYSLYWLSFSHRYWPRNQKSTLKTDKWQTQINP